MPTQVPAALLERRLSVDRLAPYRAASQGNLERGLALYEWNAELAAAFWRTLGHVEIVARNAMHARLTEWSRDTFGRADWYADPGRVLAPERRRDITEARRRVDRSGKPDGPGRLVAELSFGFWRFLLIPRYERSLWLPCLRDAFPGLTGMRHNVHRLFAGLHDLRNRIAHHEPIHNRPLAELHEQAMTVLGWVCPGARTWVHGGCAVPALLATRPR